MEPRLALESLPRAGIRGSYLYATKDPDIQIILQVEVSVNVHKAHQQTLRRVDSGNHRGIRRIKTLPHLHVCVCVHNDENETNGHQSTTYITLTDMGSEGSGKSVSAGIGAKSCKPR